MVTLSYGRAGEPRRDLAVQRVYIDEQHVLEFYLNGRVWAPPIQLRDLSAFELAITTQARFSPLPFDQTRPVNLLIRNPDYRGHVGSDALIRLWDTANCATSRGVLYCDPRFTTLRNSYYVECDGYDSVYRLQA